MHIKLNKIFNFFISFEMTNLKLKISTRIRTVAKVCLKYASSLKMLFNSLPDQQLYLPHLRVKSLLRKRIAAVTANQTAKMMDALYAGVALQLQYYHPLHLLSMDHCLAVASLSKNQKNVTSYLSSKHQFCFNKKPSKDKKKILTNVAKVKV